MKLSVIIPVYNVAEWLPETVDSVLAQTFRDFELILVDDGATDGSGEICDSYAGKDSRVVVIHQKNAGVSAARNAGVAAARGEFIGFTDSDDIIEKDMYAVMMSAAEKHNAEVVQCQHDRADSLNGAARSDEIRVMTGEEFVRRMFTKTGGDYTNQVSLCSKIFKKELFENIVFPVGQVYEDEQETYKLCLKAVRLAETDDILYHYIKRDNSIITGVSARKMLDKQKALADRLHYLPQRCPELKEKCARSYFNYCQMILCQLYKAGEKDALRQGICALKAEKNHLKPVFDRYEKIYWPFLGHRNGWILKNDFAPIQKWAAKLKK
jgi:glycosyltransferase involved in cell wall biosynthesis